MINTIRNIFLFGLGFYVYFHLTNYKITISLYVKIILFTISLALLSFIEPNNLSIMSLPLLTFSLYFVSLLILSYKGPCFSFIFAIISVVVSYSVYSVIALLPSIILVFALSQATYTYIPYIIIGIGIITTISIIFLMKNKRITKALNLFCNLNNFYPIAFLILGLMFIIIVAQYKIRQNDNIKIYTIGFLLIVFVLLYVIQRQTQKYYLSKLKKLELESLRQELAEKDALIQKLQESNDYLARIIHKDNKLIPSMVSAVSRYLRNVNTLDADALRASGMTLARELEQMAQNRQGILSENEHQTDGIPHSGHAAVDAILLHMQNRAAALHIDYTVTLGAEFSDTVNRMITESDLTHLLADLIENALNATKESGTRCVLVHLGILYDAPVVEISDSGISFDPAVYQDFGLQKHSTHLTDGGSGIGLMDIWELKKKYAASLHIHEYEPGAASYTKKISVVFDRRNHYLIRTYRPQELLQYRIRTDMFILPLE